MSIEKVKAFFADKGLIERVREFDCSSATVVLAAQAACVIPARIAKTLSFEGECGGLLIVAAGDAKIDNAKYKAFFKRKATMLSADAVLSLTGHPVGGVCPFAMEAPVPVFLDISLQRFETVFPAAGSAQSAVELSCEELHSLCAGSEWVDVCKGWQEEGV